MMTRNLGLKCLAFLIAIFLFWVVNGERNVSTIKLEIPIQFRNIAEGQVIIAPLQPRVTVEIRGPRALLNKYPENPPAFKVDLRANSSQRQVIHLNAGQLDLDPFFSVSSIEPKQIEITLDSLVERELPITLVRTGSPKADINIETIDLVPAKVRISGPLAELSSVKAIETLPFNVEAINSSGSRAIKLVNPGAQTTLTPSEVTVTVRTAAQEVSTTYQNIKVEVRSTLNFPLLLEPESVSVTLRGSPSMIKTLRPEQVIPYVRVTNLSEQATQTVLVDVPENFKIEKIEPSAISIVNKQFKSRIKR